MKSTSEWILIVVVASSICSLITLGCTAAYFQKKEVKLEQQVEAQKITIEQTPKQFLTEWQVLEMAIMKTESDYNTYAVGSHNDLGLMQITEVYVDEVNRIIGEPSFVHTDAFVPEKTLEMFNIVQDNHNPKQDLIRAIQVHNPGGESIGYAKRVLQNMDYIRNYEKIREIVLEF